jgi:Domain of unknown function (DUF4345)
MNRLAQLVLIAGGGAFLGFGLFFLFDPLGLMANIGIQISGAIAATEIRAFYGGLEIALGVLILTGVFRAAQRLPALLLCGVSYAGIGLVRVAGMAVDGSRSGFLWLALATEVGLAWSALWCLWRLSKRPETAG